MFCFPDKQMVWSRGPWSTFLTGQSSNPNGKIERWQLRDKLEMELNVEILRRVVYSRNPTSVGRHIYEKCKDTPKKIHFIGWRMNNDTSERPSLTGFSSFDSDCPAIGEATIYINLDLCLQVQSPNDKNPNKILNGYIILLHEMGHAVQWLRYGSARFGTMVGKNAQRSVRETNVRSAVSPAIMAGPGKYVDKKHLIDEAVRANLSHADYYGSKFPNDIELGNWLEHEGPICDQWNIARRPAYTAISEVW